MKKFIAERLFGLACLLSIVLGLFLGNVTHADFEAIKEWEEPLICWKLDTNSKRIGEPVRLLWNNFLTFDENGKMVFLKTNRGLHKVPMKGWICVPESLSD